MRPDPPIQNDEEEATQLLQMWNSICDQEWFRKEYEAWLNRPDQLSNRAANDIANKIIDGDNPLQKAIKHQLTEVEATYNQIIDNQILSEVSIMRVPPKSDFEQCPTGTQTGRCYSIIDVGTQYNEMFDKKAHKIIIGFELPSCFMGQKNPQPGWETKDEGLKPFVISKWYTLSLHEKASLRKDLDTWRGKALEPDEEVLLPDLLDKPALLGIIEDNNGKSRIKSIVRMPEEMTCPERINPLKIFMLNDFNPTVFEELGDGLKDVIRKSPEYRKLKGLDNVKDMTKPLDDDIPF